jgi:hypothetical protein
MSDAPKSASKPDVFLRLTSYKPIAKKGPTSKQPDAIDMVYSGLDLKTAPNTKAIVQNARP